MQNCLNLSEILTPNLLEHYELTDLFELSGLSEIPERLYLGSSFCSQYFLHIDNLFKSELFLKTGIPITLTIPIFSQKDLPRAKQSIKEILAANPMIDEITVNDLGMYTCFKDQQRVKVNLGRLFFKDPRDIRVSDYNEGESSLSLTDYLDLYPEISGIEVDQISKKMNLKPLDDYTVAVHTPYTYMTTGNICKFASIPKPVEMKFRANNTCGLECAKIHEFFTEDFKKDHDPDELFRFGRTVYFLQDPAELDDLPIDRKVIFPLKELSLLEERE